MSERPAAQFRNQPSTPCSHCWRQLAPTPDLTLNADDVSTFMTVYRVLVYFTWLKDQTE